MQSLLERFGIKVPKDFDAYNLIGLDYGDGEVSAANVIWQNEKNRIDVSGLALEQSGILMKNPNAYYISPNVEKIVYDSQITVFDEEAGGIRYYNFKKCLETNEADSKYIIDDGTISELTYKEIMAKGFNILVNIMFQSNPYVLRPDRPTIILVGRPSSPGWVSSELEYAKLLQDGLKLSENQEPVYVAIQSESTAALAREIDPKWDTKRVKKGEIVVVLDNGSSTFDVTVITRKGVEGEDSYQFGGNQLDENLLKLMYKKLAEERPGASLRTNHGHKLGLRIAKESYYGIDGENYNTQIYDVKLQGVDAKGRPLKYEFRMDDDTMDEAVGGMPVRAFHFKKNLDGSAAKEPPVNCPSWIDGCKTIYRRFYDEMRGFFTKETDDPSHPVVPDRIILSGGVSIMKEVQDAVKEAFGVEPEMSDHPNYSVSEGLAYVLGTEIKKEQLRDDLIKELDMKLPGKETLVNSIGDAGEDEEWTAFKESMKEWADKRGYQSIDDWYTLWEENYFNKDLRKPVQQGAERWYKDNALQNVITNMLKARFENMFPDYVEQFEFKLPKINFSALNGVVVHIGTDYKFFFDLPEVSFNESGDKQRDQAWRQDAYQKFLAMEDKIRKGGSRSYMTMYAVERGILNRRTEYERRPYQANYDGIRSMYIREMTAEVSEGIRKDIIKLFEDPIKDYVESITPYFNMTARR